MLARVLAAMRDYRDRGALIAVDDWGTGYSDMDRLELLQPEIVKVDMSHRPRPRLRPPPGPASARSLAWAARRGARVCAEGIETEEQRERLRDLGVHLGPGLPACGRPEEPSRTPTAAETDGSPARLRLFAHDERRNTGRAPEVEPT